MTEYAARRFRPQSVPSRPGRSAVSALLLALVFALGAAAARAELLPEPDLPPYGPYREWLDARLHEPEGWIRGMHDRHWLPPGTVPRSWGEYWRDDLRLLPELNLVLWVRSPVILEQLGAQSAGEDPYANSLARRWPEAVRREILPWDDWFARSQRVAMRDLVRQKALQTQTELAQQAARGSLIDLDLPVSFPKSVERVLGRGEKSNITVTGRETISFSGETTRNSSFLSDESGRGQPLFPRLEMKQELQVKLNGTVGEKVHVEVENNSLAQGDAANRIRIRYEGDDDEVIQLIEMGDTQLSLPSSGLVSYSTQNKGLFGVKMEGHLGQLDFTAIASKQEGEVSSKTFNNTGQDVQSNEKRDIDFVANQFFYLDNPTAAGFYDYLVNEGTLEVYVSSGIAPNANSADALSYFKGRAYVDSANVGLGPGQHADQAPEVQPFRLLDSAREWSVIRDVNENFYILKLTSPISESARLAVSYVGLQGSAERQVGDSSVGKNHFFHPTPDTLRLEMIKPDPYRPRDPTWDYMLRNIYNLGGRGLDFNTLEVSIERISTSETPDSPEGSALPYLRFFGLDQHAGTSIDAFSPDGQIDFDRVDTEQGLLIFPWYRPFNPPDSLVCAWTTQNGVCDSLVTDDLNPALYETDRETILDNPSLYSRFKILYKSATVASRFSLNAFDILEGSEVVTLDGSTLTKGTDYSIDYFSGEVELKGDAAARLTASSNLQVTYQYKPFIGGGTSSLLGMHGTYRLGEKNYLASSWLYESQNSGARRPRLGEESTRNVVGNLLGNFSANPEFLTRAANLLPLVDTDAASTASLSGELAVSFPNPNIDNEAFLDDMEGAEDADELSIHRSQWVLASEPADVIRVPGGADIEVQPGDRARDYYWFHPQNTTRRGDFNLNLPEQEANEILDVLQLSVPVNLTEAQLDAFPNLVATDAHNREKGNALWAGLMRGFPGQGLDLSQAEYLEIWVNDFQQAPGQRIGRVHFDLGAINEDYWNPELGEEDTEDPDKLGIFNVAEQDIGLDGKSNAEESVSPEFPHPYRSGEDPAGDDYDPSLQAEAYGNSYFKVNGTDGNKRLDTEDLNADGDLDQIDNYFTLEIDLDDEAFTDMVEVYEEETGAPPGGNKAWRLYRINLDDARVISDGFDTPDWTRIRYFRFWVEGFANPGQDPARPFNRLEIASIKLVGNRWKSQGIQDAATGSTLAPGELTAGEDMRVEVVNTKDNANFTWPFGEEIDPDTGLPEREQALDVVYEYIQPGHQAVIRKDYQGLDLTGYRFMSFYVHTDAASVDRDLFLRAAQDSSEYYEWRFRPTREGWNEITLKLQDWTDLKIVSDADTVSTTVSDQSFPGREYTLTRVRSPDLSRIRAFFFGVVNGEDDEPLTGETWLNDLRVRDVKRSTGFAGKLSGNLNMAGVVNLGFQFQEQDAEYRGLRATAGQGSRTRSWSLTGRSSLQHYVPLAGYKLPVNVSFGKTLSLPKYRLSSDVELTGADREREKLTSTSQSFSANLSRSPSKNWFGRLLLDKFKLAGSVNQSRSRGPTNIDLRETISYNASYETQFKDRRLGLPLGVQLRWLPSSLRLKSDVTRSRTESWRGSDGRYVLKPKIRSGRLVNTASTNWAPLESFRADFSINENRDLEHERAERLDWFGRGLNIGFQTTQGQSLRIDYTLPFVRRFRPKFNFSSNYSQAAQSVGVGGSTVLAGSRNLSNSNSISTNYNFQVGKWFESLGGQRLKDFRAKNAPEPTEASGKGPRVTPRSQARRLLVPVDPLRGPDPRMKKRRTRRYFEDELEVVAARTEAAADSSGGGVDPMFIVWRTLDILTDLKPLKVDLSRNMDTRFSNMRGAPTLLYRLGFSENPELPGAVGGVIVPAKAADTFNEARVLRLSTGVTVAENLQVTTNLDYNRNDRRSGLSRTVTRSRKWPSFNVDLSGVERWPLWGAMMQTSSIGFGWTQDSKVTENLTNNSEDRSSGLAISPRWSVTWANKMQTSLAANYSSNTREQNTSETRDSKFSLDLSWNHNLSAPGGLPIPGLRGIRFSSRMDLNATMGYQRLRQVRVDGDFETPLSGSTTFKISPGASYQFTEKLRGSANITFSRTNQELQNNVVSRLRLDLKTTFVF